MSINVLWIEDEPNTLRYERRIAEVNHDWQITINENVADALRSISEDCYDILVVDIILPMNEFEQKRGEVSVKAGIDLLEKIRDFSRIGNTANDVLLLVVSCVISPNQKGKVLKHLKSPSHYISKPIDHKTFFNIVSEISENLI